uniref:Ubiquitin-like domain-containing protein n=1 Tax=Caenorhabditis japonica TaxID=281687 RepID=A0A8R1IBT6_CAEJA
MFIVIDLRDHENKSYDTVKFDLATIKQLQDKILSRFQIGIEYQQIYDSKNSRIDLLNGSLEGVGLKDNETLILKHAELPWWSQYKKAVGIAMKAGPDRMENAKEAVKLHMRLLEKGFFNVYSSFNEFRLENHYKVASWTDGNTELMREATRNHFLRQHFKRGADDESDFVCRFEARPRDLGGSRKNTLAYVQLHGEKEETKYNVNDKLTGSRTSMYIATKWCDNFVPISHIEEEDVSADILVQILLLGTFLFIDDLHSDNCGQWKGTKEAAIVDFMPRAYTSYTNVKKALLDNSSSVYWEAIHIDALEKCNEKSRLEMAKECLKKWDLLSKIEMANEQIKPEKDRMKRQDIGFKGFNSPTEELDQYIIAVKENLTKLTVMLNEIDLNELTVK